MKLLICLIVSLVLFSCNSKREEQPSAPAEIAAKPVFTLSGSNYFFAPEFDAEICEGIAECDCCSWNILFIDDKNFITICPCESDESVYKGTYQIFKDKVILSYNTLAVDRTYNGEADVDTTGTVKPEYDIAVTERPVTTEVLKVMHCENKLYFTIEADKELSYGVIDKRYSLKQHIQILKDEGLWDKIQTNL